MLHWGGGGWVRDDGEKILAPKVIHTFASHLGGGGSNLGRQCRLTRAGPEAGGSGQSVSSCTPARRKHRFVFASIQFPVRTASPVESIVRRGRNVTLLPAPSNPALQLPRDPLPHSPIQPTTTAQQTAGWPDSLPLTTD